MSNDLISRSELMEGRVENDPVRIAAMCAPTFYDLDAVCKALDKASDYYETNEQGKEHVQMVNLAEAFEIVRNGGKKE